MARDASVPEAVPELRLTVREYLGAACPDVELCVTELVGNVIRHVGQGTVVRVSVARVDGRIRVEVADPAPAHRRCAWTRATTTSSAGAWPS
ncbi:ATP-binding protein [Streptomyces sp. NPDC020801]|uniref:ATP-binding protein n=1 Tax=unclassified Streptomyces TaxID=2593676 RepID=UPI00378B4748